MATEVEASMPAAVWKVVVASGDHVEEGDVLLILESMKMEIPIDAPVGGTCRVLVAAGDAVEDGTVLAVIE